MNQGENERGEIHDPVPPSPNGSICYLFGALFPLLYFLSGWRDQNVFLRFHCFQSLLLFIIWVPLILFNRQTQSPVLTCTALLCGIAWIVAMIKAKRGKMFRLPIIGAAADWLAKL